MFLSFKESKVLKEKSESHTCHANGFLLEQEKLGQEFKMSSFGLRSAMGLAEPFSFWEGRGRRVLKTKHAPPLVVRKSFFLFGCKLCFDKCKIKAQHL